MTAVVRGPALLVELNRREVLDAVDVHVAARLSALALETNEAAQLALALCVRSVRQGSVVLDLATVPERVLADDGLVEWPALGDWRAALDSSPLVGGPLHREGDLLWLDRSWRQEVFVAKELLARAARPVELDPARLRDALARLWPVGGQDDQRQAAAVCALSTVSVLGGGPGTGKTTTVSRLLVALAETSPEQLRIALAAPTGKAAARLAESLQRDDEVLAPQERSWLATLPSSTLHRLLGLRRGGGSPWHHRGNRLPYDVVVVDEASMVSLAMFARLLDALRPGARLVLVGDPDQLASVEAGAVLKDLVESAGKRTAARAAQLAQVVPSEVASAAVSDSPGARLRDGIALLTRTRRYDAAGPIDRMARAIRAGEASLALDVLRRDLVFVEVADDALVPDEEVRPVLVEQMGAVVSAARAGDGEAALAALSRHRLLCAHRTGPRGVRWWDERVPRWLVEDLGVTPRRDGRFVGQPLLVLANDYDNGLWNGDAGVVLSDAEDLVGHFAERRVPLARLREVAPLYAMTVHRAQGSQFDAVTVVLPVTGSPLGTRETVYTAVTRAESAVTVVGSEAAFVDALGRSVPRASGLPARLA